MDNLIDYRQVNEGDVCYVHSEESELVFRANVTQVDKDFLKYAFPNCKNPAITGEVRGAEGLSNLLIVKQGKSGISDPEFLVGNRLFSSFLEANIPL